MKERQRDGLVDEKMKGRLKYNKITMQNLTRGWILQRYKIDIFKLVRRETKTSNNRRLESAFDVSSRPILIPGSLSL